MLWEVIALCFKDCDTLIMLHPIRGVEMDHMRMTTFMLSYCNTYVQGYHSRRQPWQHICLLQGFQDVHGFGTRQQVASVSVRTGSKCQPIVHGKALVLCRTSPLFLVPIFLEHVYADVGRVVSIVLCTCQFQ